MGIGTRLQSEHEKTNDSKKNDNGKSIVFEVRKPKYTIKDAVLSEKTGVAISDFLAYKENYDTVFNVWNLKDTHAHHHQTSVNFYGPPGTGKTFSAHGIAHSLGKNIISVNYADIESKFVGETSKNITTLFELAAKEDCVIFFDEADAILSRRVSNMSTSSDVSVNQTRSVLLTLMDNHKGLIIFATNFITNYDPAFMRRILSHIEFTLPDEKARTLLWEKYIPESLPLNPTVSYVCLANLSESLAGADISNAVLKAALSAARQNKLFLDLEDFSNAIIEIKASKAANNRLHDISPTTTEQRVVTENIVVEKLGKDFVEEVKK